MNKEYTYIDGKVIVEDTEGNKRPVEYSDNLDEILIEENLIEAMEDRISKVDKKIQDDESQLKKDKKKLFEPLITAIIMTALVPAFVKILIGDIASMSFGLPDSAFVEMFGNISISTLTTVFTGIIGTFIMGMITLGNYSLYRELKRKIKGLYSEKKELKENLVIEKQKLSELQENKQIKVETEQFIVRKVDDKEILEGLKVYLQLYYDCGYNEEVYAKYYMDGILYKKLRKYYSEACIEEIESYLKEKGYQSSKTRIRKR